MKSYEERRAYLRELDSEAALIMVYVWVKSATVGKKQYLELIADIYRRKAECEIYIPPNY